MATTTSVSPTPVDRTVSSRRHQSQSTPSRSQSTRTKSGVPPSPQRANSTHHRTSSRHGAVEDVLPQRDYETSNVAQSTRRSDSKDRPHQSRHDSTRSNSEHHRTHRSSRHSTDMATATNGGGPAPVVVPTESRHSGRGSGKSRTTIPAPTGDWVLGKTIGAGSMGKVKLARKVEGGEQV
jgi:hypothetical protein